MKYHRTRDGKKIKLSNLELEHLINIIKYIKRKAKEGFRIEMGGGQDADDMWYNFYIIYGKEAKKYMRYKAYKKELKRRMKNESK